MPFAETAEYIEACFNEKAAAVPSNVHQVFCRASLFARCIGFNCLNRIMPHEAAAQDERLYGFHDVKRTCMTTIKLLSILESYLRLVD